MKTKIDLTPRLAGPMSVYGRTKCNDNKITGPAMRFSSPEESKTIGVATFSTDQSVEQEIQSKGLTAPRVTPADIEANIADTVYFSPVELVQPEHLRESSPLRLLTFCVLVLRNGFTVTGESACASPENFDAEIGRRIARQNAVQKIWPLMGYALKQSLSDNV